MKRYGSLRSTTRIILCLAVLFLAASVMKPAAARAGEPFVIAASPSLRELLEQLSHEFEQSHPDVRVKLYFDSGLDLRRTIAGMENNMIGKFFIGTGPIHLVAPGGDEVITRLESRNYVLYGNKRPYAQEQLVLVVPESLVEAPESFEGIDKQITRLAVADPGQTNLGKQTYAALAAYGLTASLKGRLDVATDSRGVLDHVLGGQADAGIIYGHEAFKHRERLRVVAVADRGYDPVVHSMTMERYCPNRALCEEFLKYIQSQEAQHVVRQVGYGVPTLPRQ